MTDKTRLKKLLDEGMDILDTLKKEGLDEFEEGSRDDIKDIEEFIESADAQIKVETSFDRMAAYLFIKPHKKKGRPASVEDVMKIINSYNIVYGIDTKAIKESVDKANSGKSIERVKIAQGKPYVPAIPGKYIYLYENKKDEKIIKADDRIDYKEMNNILSVEENEEIITFVEGTPGQDGIDITGNVVEAPEMDSVHLTPGANVEYDEEKKLFIARKPGRVKIDSDDVVSVVMELVVDGNYDMRYGNLDFDGILVVNGDIEEGYNINVKGDILVKGSIYGSDVFSKSDIIVEKGIITKKEHSLSAEGNIECRFIENSNVFAKKDISVSGVILQSEVISLGSIKVDGEKGQILNSEVFAWNNVECQKLGSEMGLKTLVCAGVNMVVQKEIIEKNQKVTRLRKVSSLTTDYLKKVLDTIENKSNVPTEVKKILGILSVKGKKVVAEIDQIKNNILEVESDLYNLSGFPSIKVHKEVFEGVTIQVGKAFIVNNSRAYGQKYIWDKASNKVILSA